MSNLGGGGLIDDVKNLNIEYIESLLTDLAKSALSNDISLVQKTVTVNIPEQMAHIVTHIVANSEYTENEVLSKMCSISLKENIEGLLGKNKKEVVGLVNNPFDVLSKSSEFADLGAKIKDMENITSQFESMKQGIEALSKIAEMMEKKQ